MLERNERGRLLRDRLEPERFQYLGEDDSRIYAGLMDSTDARDQLICKLLEDKAEAFYSAHCACTY